jgi:hypothetical protein
MHAGSELDNACTIIASAHEKVRVLRAGAGEVRNLMPRVSVDLDLELVSRPAAQIGLGCRRSEWLLSRSPMNANN